MFGYNGRGKSSFALGIIDTYKSSHDTEDSFRFFNRDYVKETLLLNGEESIIKGVKVTFSKNDAEIAKQIRELEVQKYDVKVLSDNVDKSRKRLRNTIDQLHERNRGKARINKKKADLSIEEVIRLYNEDLKKAHEITLSDEFIKEAQGDSEELEERKAILEMSFFPNLIIKKISEEDQEFLKNTLKKSYRVDNDIPSMEEIRWLEKGLFLHNDEDNQCKFCKNSFNIYDVISRLKEYKENEMQKDLKRLENIKSVVIKNIEIVDKGESFKDNLLKIGIQPSIMNSIYKSHYFNQMKSLVSTIDDKMKDMSVVFENSDCIPIFELEIDRTRDIIQRAHKDKMKQIDKTINNIETIAKGKIALVLKDNYVNKRLKNIKKIEKKILKIIKANNKLDQQIKELLDKQSEYIDFMNFLNNSLESLGIQIKLTLKEENYYLKHTIEELELTIDDISEGEKNLLSLLYFYFELYSDVKQKKLKEVIKLIVVDDPISSLDDANKFYVLEIVKKILDEKTPQIFVLTHSWDDFCQITYKLKNNSNVKLLEIYKDSKKDFQSTLRECATNISPYKKLFTELNDLSKKDSSALDNCDNYHAANSMRRVFEEFLNFKKPNLLPQKGSQSCIEDMYWKATGNEMLEQKKRELGRFLSFINVLSHRPIRSDEILANSKFLMEFIKTMDKVHYESMIQII